MDFLIILLTIIVGVIFIYLLSTWNYSYFEKLGIPHVKPTPFFGNMTAAVLRTKAMPEIIQELYDVHPEAKYVGIYDFSAPTILLKDPELVKAVAIKNFDSFTDHKGFDNSANEPLFAKNLFALKGDEWRDMRALLSPAFSSSKMKAMFKIVSQCAKNFADHLAGLNPQPEELDMKDTFGRYTLDVIASTAFGLSVNCMADRDNNFYRMGKKVADFSGWKGIKFLIKAKLPGLIGSLLNLKINDDESSEYFTNVIKSTIAARDAQGIVRPDMIQLMMQARDKKEKSTPLSIEDMTAQAFLFFLGGFDSPATTMCFAAHALALNQDVQKKLQAEIDQVLENSTDEVSYEDLHAMKYLDAVVSEALRVFPPGAVMDRVGPKSFTLPPALPGLEPLEIRPGQAVWIPAYSFHHDPKYFPNPEKFDPERFSEENKSKISPLTYFPFGIGPRICIANRFALMEVKLALFHLLSKCNLLPSPKTPTPIKLSPKTFLMIPEGGFWLKVEARK